MDRCPHCDHILYKLTMTHPWRLYCPKCRQEEAGYEEQVSILAQKFYEDDGHAGNVYKAEAHILRRYENKAADYLEEIRKEEKDGES